MMLRRSRAFRVITTSILVALVYEVVSPLAAWALTSGPAQPEFSSFEPVATTDMVNTFTGQFTYNLPVVSIPGPNGSGYALSLSYHSGASSEEEASWVGFGWTLNPGSIIRNKRGFPDDYKQAQIRYWNKVDKNWTVAVNPSASLEAFSSDLLNVGLGITEIRYNNYSGIGFTAGADLNVMHGLVNLGYHINDGEGSFSVTVNPAALLAENEKKW